jgi:hypothetical protein
MYNNNYPKEINIKECMKERSYERHRGALRQK